LITDPIFYLLAIPAVISLGLSKGGFSGVGQIATPLIALILPPLEAAAILLPIMLMQDAVAVFVFRRDWDAWNLKVLLPGAVLGIGAGWLFAAYVSSALVSVLLGVTSILFVLNSWFRSHHYIKTPHRPSAISGIFWGSLSGFTSTVCQAGGPPYQMHVLPQRLPKMTFVGTTALFFAIVNALKVIPYFALGQFSTAGFATSLALFPFALITNALGIWLVRRMPPEIFYKIAYLLIFLISFELIRSGTVALLRG
jgi:uncharacterized membrane protein YfcA